MRYLNALALAALVVVPAARAQTDAPVDTAGFVSFQDPDGRFSLRVPPNWPIEPQHSDFCFGAGYADEGPSPTAAIANVFCDMEPTVVEGETLTAADIVELLSTRFGRATFMRTLGYGDANDTSFAYLSHNLADLGGTPAVRIVYDLSMPVDPVADGPVVVLRSVMYLVPQRDGGDPLNFNCGTTEPSTALCDAVAGTFTSSARP
ncbi:MAG TPA: hypothetical protein VGB53_02720 [Rubricoccaceae bacterium]|jgi:hypothetical protein